MTTREQQIQARCQAATEGPWLYRPRPPLDDWGDVRNGPDGYLVALARDAGATDYKQKDEHRKNKTDPYEANGQFIAHAREDIPYLLARLSACEAALAPFHKLHQVVIHNGRWQQANSTVYHQEFGEDVANITYGDLRAVSAALTKEPSDV